MAEQGNEGGRAGARWRRAGLAALLLAGLGAVAVIGWLALRPGPPPVPGGDLSGAEPRVARSVEEARSAVRSAPASADAWGRLGMVLMAHEYVREARPCFEQAEARAPGTARWAYLRAFTYLNDDPVLAAELLGRAVALDPKDTTCRLQLADTLMSLGRIDEAERHYLAALDDPAAEARAHLGLGRVSLARDDLAGARAHAERSAAAAPSLRAPVELLAQVHLRGGDAAAAEREQARLGGLSEAHWPDPHLEAVMRLNVGEAPRLELARRLLDQGTTADALMILEEVVRDHPASVPGWLSLCRARLRLGQWAAAQTAAERALALAPQDALGWADLATAVGMQGQWRRASDCYHESLRLNPQDGDTYYQLAFVQLQLGDPKGAESSFRESVRVRPQFAPGWRELGRQLARRGEDGEAEECLRRAVDLAPDDAEARDLLDEVSRRVRPRR